MNRKETIAAIEVMQAWVDGKQIQGRYQGAAWQDFEPYHLSTWSWADWEYRIKPVPLVCYRTLHRDGKYGAIAFATEAEAMVWVNDPMNEWVGVRKFIEVME